MQKSIITANEDEIKKVDKILLPGVDVFDAGMSRLNETGLTYIIKQQALEDKKPIPVYCIVDI